MRKNLHYKVLASVLALGAFSLTLPGNVLAAANENYTVEYENKTVTGTYVIVDGNGYKFTFEGQAFNIYGVNKYSSSGDAEDANKANVTIKNNSIITNVYGGYSYNKDGNSGNAIGNYVTINNSNSSAPYIYGGYSYSGKGNSGNATDNHVTINSSTAYEVFGGYTKADVATCGNATGNYVTINNNSTVNYVYGGYSDKGNVTDNHVIITDSTINNDIYAGFIIGNRNTNSEIKNNSVTIKGNTDITKANIYGSFLDRQSPDVKRDNNILILDGWSGTANSINGFQNIEFKNIIFNNNPVLNLTNNTNTSDLSSVKNITVSNFAGGQKFSKGDTFTLIGNANSGAITTQNFNTTAGVTTDVGGVVEQNGNDVVMKVNSVELNGQTKLVAQTRAASAAFINQGTDLIEGSLDVISRDGSYGVKTFAAVHGNRSKYDVNSDLKINGWSTIVGVGNETEHNGGDFSWGVFYENGSGNYRTFNSFNNEFFRGDGSLVYNGGGIAARYENAHGVYTEGSLRAGMLKSEMTNALRDGEGNNYGYKSESEYYGAHIGVGQIIPLTESSDLDVYGKFFHTYTQGDSFDVDGDKFEFDGIDSDRLRVGARITTNKANKFSTYYGLAYEYEFNGDADMRAQNLKAPTQSLQGSSYMAEVGFNYQPAPDSPWSFDLNMRGYAGEREGASFNVQATYTF